MLKKIAFFAFILLYSTFIYSQTSLLGINEINMRDKFISVNHIKKYTGAKTQVDGSIMLFDENKVGYLVLKNRERSEMMQLNYHLLEEQTIIVVKGQEYALENRLVDSLIIMEGNKLSKYVYLNHDDRNVAMEVIVDSNFPLLKNTHGELVRPNYNVVLGTGNKLHTIKLKNNFFTSEGGKINRLPSSSKKILKSNDFSEKFKSLLGNKNAKIKKEKDLVKVFRRINAKG